MKLHLSVFIGTIFCLVSPAFFQEKFNIAESINKFSIELLANVNLEGGENLNIALSPLTIWTMLTVISEGAFDSTAEQLDRVLGQPENKNVVRDAYERFSRLLKQNKLKETEFESSTGIFSRSEFPVKEKFASIVKQYYDTSITPVDFKSDNQKAAEIINKYVASATRNRIPMLVTPADVQDAYLFITSTMYFKGQWQVPFNRSFTKKDSFFDDDNKKIGEVQLMYQSHPFGYFRVDAIKADAVQLPYGPENGMFCMVVLVPRGAQTVTNMLNALTRVSMTDILSRLKMNHQTFAEDDVRVYLPKFKITSDFNLDRVLDRMGIQDIFNSQKANLLGIFSHYLFLSRVIQKAEIEVDEEGTVASAAGGSIFLNRTPPPTVKANRPFAFFIIHKETGTTIFSGKFSTPGTLEKQEF